MSSFIQLTKIQGQSSVPFLVRVDAIDSVEINGDDCNIRLRCGKAIECDISYETVLEIMEGNRQIIDRSSVD